MTKFDTVNAPISELPQRAADRCRAPEWKQYRRTNIAEMRPVDPNESLELVSISAPDAALFSENRAEFDRGFIARNPQNHADQWYVARAYFDANFEPLS